MSGRSFIGGDGSDKTNQYWRMLADGGPFYECDLVIINTGPTFAGKTLGKQFRLTNFGTPVTWSYKGDFVIGNFKREGAKSKVGLEADTNKLEWWPRDSDVLATDNSGNTLLTAIQGVRFGIFNQGTIEIWRCIMPARGDADSIGATLMFEGVVGDCNVAFDKITLNVVSRLDALNAKAPPNTVEPTNIYAMHSTGMIPTGGPAAHTVLAGTTVSRLVGGSSPTMKDATYDDGYLALKSGKLAGFFVRINQQTVEDGHDVFYLAGSLPFVPEVGDSFSAYVPVPIDLLGARAAGVPYAGFRLVPDPIASQVMIA